MVAARRRSCLRSSLLGSPSLWMRSSPFPLSVIVSCPRAAGWHQDPGTVPWSDTDRDGVPPGGHGRRGSASPERHMFHRKGGISTFATTGLECHTCEDPRDTAMFRPLRESGPGCNLLVALWPGSGALPAVRQEAVRQEGVLALLPDRRRALARATCHLAWFGEPTALSTWPSRRPLLQSVLRGAVGPAKPHRAVGPPCPAARSALPRPSRRSVPSPKQVVSSVGLPCGSCLPASPHLRSARSSFPSLGPPLLAVVHPALPHPLDKARISATSRASSGSARATSGPCSLYRSASVGNRSATTMVMPRSTSQASLPPRPAR